MDWIRVPTRLSSTPAVAQIADELSLPAVMVVGALHGVWSWADAMTSDGTIAGPSPVLVALIDRAATVTGFAQAMQRAGLLQLADGSIAFPDWAERSPAGSARSREQARIRMARSRARRASAAAPDTVVARDVLRATGATGDANGCDKTRIETETEENSPIIAASPAELREADDRADSLRARARVHWGGNAEQTNERRERLVQALLKMGAGPDDLDRTVAAYRRQWPTVMCTPEALLRHWDTFSGPGGCPCVEQPAKETDWAQIRTPEALAAAIRNGNATAYSGTGDAEAVRWWCRYQRRNAPAMLQRVIAAIGTDIGPEWWREIVRALGPAGA